MGEVEVGINISTKGEGFSVTYAGEQLSVRNADGGVAVSRSALEELWATAKRNTDAWVQARTNDKSA